jgi:hypothetical protein
VGSFMIPGITRDFTLSRINQMIFVMKTTCVFFEVGIELANII